MRFKSYKTDFPHIFIPCCQIKMSVILQNSNLVRVGVFKAIKKTCFIPLRPAPGMSVPSLPLALTLLLPVEQSRGSQLP